MWNKKIPSYYQHQFDRRRFLKACGLLGVGAVAGGVIQSTFDVVGLRRGLKKVSQTRLAMGTYVTVTAVGQSRDQAEQAIGCAFEEMNRLVAIFNRHDSATPLSLLNRDGILADPPSELVAVVNHSKYFNVLSRGAFDPTVKPLIDLFDERFAQAGATPPSATELQQALTRVGAEALDCSSKRISFHKPDMSITLDGIAKGFIVDQMSSLLSEQGLTNHLINAGGDIRTSGSTLSNKPWTVAVEDPKKNGDYPDFIAMNNGAVATSGSYEIYYDQQKVFHHIVNPRTGLSPQECVSATVSAGSVMQADALATALFVMKPVNAVQLVHDLPNSLPAKCLILDPDGKRYPSVGWPSAWG